MWGARLSLRFDASFRLMLSTFRGRRMSSSPSALPRGARSRRTALETFTRPLDAWRSHLGFWTKRLRGPRILLALGGWAS